MLYPDPLDVNATDTWDRIYTTNSNTDMHSSWNNVNYQFALEGDASILYDLSFMAARRMLHTQIIQPDRENSSYFMGWGYAGYARYRGDGNSMHTYFENLYSYYYLTGDMEVLDVVKAGGENKSSHLTRDDGELNDPTIAPDWGNHHGRSGTHAALMFNFLGHTYDANYFDDFKHMYEHVFSRNIALLTGSNGTEYGFIIGGVTGDTSFGTEQFWMGALYPMHSLYILSNEWGNLELGVDNIPVSRVYEAVANGYKDYLTTLNPNGDGTWGSTWVNVAEVNYSGNKIGGAITSIEDSSISPPSMYSSGKFPVITLMLRAGKISGDNDLTQFGLAGIDWTDSYEEYNGLEDDLWAKVSGIIMSRFHHAMAYIEDN